MCFVLQYLPPQTRRHERGFAPSRASWKSGSFGLFVRAALLDQSQEFPVCAYSRIRQNGAASAAP